MSFHLQRNGLFSGFNLLHLQAKSQRDTFGKTRLAPTPSGYLHLGNAFSFALTASLAARHSAPVFLRIDDLDQDRTRPEYLKDIFETLHFLEIPWTGGPKDVREFSEAYSQQLRLNEYRKALETLRHKGYLFACTCSRSDLEPDGTYPGTCRDKNIPFDTAGAAWRFRTESNEMIRVPQFGKDPMPASLPASMKDFLVRKKDGFPAYQLATVVDDELFGIASVVRGEDLIPSTLGQALIAKALGFARYLRINFVFHSLIRDTAERKLSKSAGDLSLTAMRKAGMTRQDVFRLMGLRAGLKEETASWEPLARLIFG